MNPSQFIKYSRRFVTLVNRSAIPWNDLYGISVAIVPSTDYVGCVGFIQLKKFRKGQPLTRNMINKN
jgi:hypothetical protein